MQNIIARRKEYEISFETRKRIERARRGSHSSWSDAQDASTTDLIYRTRTPPPPYEAESRRPSLDAPCFSNSMLSVPRPLPDYTPSAQSIVVAFEGEDDPEQPLNWSTWRKAAFLVVLVQITLVISLASSVYGPAVDLVAAEFGISSQVASLGSSIFLAGIAVGSLFAGPLSECFGRLPMYCGPLTVFTIAHVACALHVPWPVFVVFRFFAGLSGAGSMAISGGSLADVLTPTARTAIFPILACASFAGPTLGASVGGFAADSTAGWRVSQTMVAGWSGLLLLIIALGMPETYAPAILRNKAVALNRQYDTTIFRTAIQVETGRDTAFRWSHLSQAFVMFVKEPPVLAMTLYISLSYVLLYATFSAQKSIFEDRHWSLYQLSFTYFSIALGVGLGALATPFVYRRYLKKVDKLNNEKASSDSASTQSFVPEAESRLKQLCFTCWLLPSSLFLTGFTASPSISAAAPIAAGVPFGISILYIYIAAYQYLIDLYGPRSGSALASNNFLRYSLSAAMTHLSPLLGHRLGFKVAYSILGSLALVMCAVPFAFFFFGHLLRSNAALAPDPLSEEKMAPVLPAAT